MVSPLQKRASKGQKLPEKRPLDEETPRQESFIDRHRKLIAFLIPFIVMHSAWWSLAFRYNLFRLYSTRYEMPITMIFGATVAGMTSEGGGAVAFPVMTLLLGLQPAVARDFSLMIQSCGMTSAAYTIGFMKVAVEWNAVGVVSIGAVGGIIFGLEVVDPLLGAAEKKMLFVAIWSSFAAALFLLNRQKQREVFDEIQGLCAWKLVVLFVTGFVGGICSGFAGSGVDICAFSILTLLFRVSEKVATPTSVVLMAINTCVGFFWRDLVQDQVSQMAWEYFAVSVPVVVICAPMGSLLGSHFHRLTLAGCVYVLEALAMIGFLATAPPVHLVLIGAAIIVLSFLFFTLLAMIGEHLAEGEKPRLSIYQIHSLQPPSLVAKEGELVPMI